MYLFIEWVNITYLVKYFVFSNRTIINQLLTLMVLSFIHELNKLYYGL